MTPDICISTAPRRLVEGVLADADCQTFGLVERGYAALAAPGSSTSLALTSMMVIAVALFGYRLMMGRGAAISDLTGLAVRLGIVLMLAASWGTFQEVVYDMLARAPTRIAEDLVASIDAPKPLGGIQSALDKIEAASIGWRQRAGIASPLVGGPPTTAMTLNVSAFLLTLTTLGLLVVSRVVLALLVAVAPVIAGFLLFDATRGLIEGWLRAIVAAALVPVGVLALAAIELAIIQPMLDRILQQQAAGQYLEESITPLGLVTIIYSIAVIASLGALRTIARGIRLGRSREVQIGQTNAVAPPVAALSPIAREALALPSPPSVVRALEASSRRDDSDARTNQSSRSFRGGHAMGGGESVGPAHRAQRNSAVTAQIVNRFVEPVGRRNQRRVSRSARRRDL
jgi:type IV secretion system protein VirB6